MKYLRRMVSSMEKIIILLFCFITYTRVFAQEVSSVSINERFPRNTNYKKLSTFFPIALPYKINLLNDAMPMNFLQVNNLADSPSFLHMELMNTSIIHQWRHITFYGIENGANMIGLMEKRNAEVGIIYSYDKLFFSVGLMANVYNFSPLSIRYGSKIQNQFGINGRFSYEFNKNVSVTVYGLYVTNSFYYSMASFPYVATSSFGGFITLHDETYGIDLGVNKYYDAFNHSWRTNPIVRPTYKMGKVKMSIDLGPLMKEGLHRLMKKRKVDGPIIMPSK